MEHIIVYDYEHPVEYLRAYYRSLAKKNAKFSLRAFSKRLGMSSPSSVSAIFNGTRNFTPSLARKFSMVLNIDKNQQRYLELICLFNLEKNPEVKIHLLDAINKLRPQSQYNDLSMDTFSTIRSWYHMAILSAGRLKKFRPHLKNLHKVFRGDIVAKEAEQAVGRLERLGFIKNNGTTFKTKEKIHFGDEIPSKAIRKYHEEVIDLAKKAIHEQEINERDLRASTFGISKKKYKQAINLIKKCHQDLLDLECEDGDQIYQFNTQFFSLTKNEAKGNE